MYASLHRIQTFETGSPQEPVPFLRLQCLARGEAVEGQLAWDPGTDFYLI